MESTERKTTRRRFLTTAGATGLAAFYVAKTSWAQQSPNAKLNVAFVGVGGIGGSHTEGAFGQGVACPCCAEVDSRRLENVTKRWPDAVCYSDYREMFDKQQKDIDAVMVGTPDHHHFPATIIAMQLGKHVYTQKPLTHTIWEARELLKASQKYKVATQMGNQGHANEGNRIIYEYIRSGWLGEIKTVHAWTNRPIWPQGIERPEGEDPVPPEMNWDVWLGPAPVRPYKQDVYHPSSWRGWWDFGGGAVGDMACHTIDGMVWGMDAVAPAACEPVALMPVNDETFPSAASVRWDFPANDWRGAFEMYWHEGGLKPAVPPELRMGKNLPETGNLIIGSKATLLVVGDYGDSPRIIPEDKRKELGKPPQLLERSPGHMEEWFMACRGEKPIDFPKSGFSYSVPLTETALLGNLAMRTQHRLEWNSEKLEVTNLPEANKFVNKEYREGWRFQA
ncbi:MAG: hypothetical protein QG656_2561 [Candidatus Hydrogenedentes bacterium]|nr:hypothetical protein [Candidatus Hydrogenedentota bacterium]